MSARDRIPCGCIVAGVDYDVIEREDVQRIARCEAQYVRHNVSVPIEPALHDRKDSVGK